MPNKENKNQKILYDALTKDGYDLGSFDQFSEKVKDEANRKILYETISKDSWDVGDYDSFSQKLSGSVPESNPLEQPLHVEVPESIRSANGLSGSNTTSAYTLPETIIKRPKTTESEPEDDRLFEENMQRMKEGKPLNRVTTQSVIDANPDLGLQGSSYQPTEEEIRSYTLRNKPGMFKNRTSSLIDKPLGDAAESAEGYGVKANARVDLLKKYYSGDEFKQRIKKETGARVTDLLEQTDADLNTINEKISAHQKAMRNENWRPGMPSSRDDNTLVELRRQRTLLNNAENILDDSRKIVDEAGKKDSSWYESLGRGVRDKVFDVDSWTMGITDMAGSMNLNKVLEKADREEELDPAEQRLLDAAVTNMAVNAYYSSDLSAAYKAGQVTGESIPFMLEMAVNPISASGNATAKLLLKYGLKKFGQQIGKNVGKTIGAAAGMTATTGLPGVIGGGYDRMNGQIQFGLDDKGQLTYTGREGSMGAGEAFAKSAASRFLENHSEMVFNAFNGMGDVVWRGVQKIVPEGVNGFIQKAAGTGAGKMIRDWGNNETMKELAKRTQFHGIAGEYLEEVYNNLANVPLGEMTMEQVLDLDQNIDTFLGLAPTSVFFGVLGLGSMTAERIQHKKKMESAFGNMTKVQRDKLAELERMSKQNGNADIRTFIKETMADPNLTREQKRQEIEYAYDIAVNNAFDEVAQEQAREQAESRSSAQEEGAAAYASGDPSAVRESVVREEVSRERLEEVLPDIELLGRLYQADDAGRAEILGELPEEVRERAKEYLYSMDKRQAVEDAIDEAHVPEVEAAEARVAEMTQHGRVTVVSLGKHGDATHTHGVVVNGLDENGTATTNGGLIMVVPIENGPAGLNFGTYDSANSKPIQMEVGAELVQMSPEDVTESMLGSYQKDVDNLQSTPILAGQRYELTDETGQSAVVEVQSIDVNGNVSVLINGQPSMLPESKLQEMVEGSRRLAVEAEYAGAEAERQAVKDAAKKEAVSLETKRVLPDGRLAVFSATNGEEVSYNIVDINGKVLDSDMMPASEFEALNIYEPENPSAEEDITKTETRGFASTDVPQTSSSEFPTKKDGSPDYDAFTPQQAYEYTSRTESPEVALEDLKVDMADGQEEIAKVQEQISKARGGKRAELRDKLKSLVSAQNKLESFYQTIVPAVKQKRLNDPQQYRLSDEVDENGRQFVLSSSGNVEFGVIGKETGLSPAPILLSEGIITNPTTNDGYGLVHIEARHGDQIRKAGYNNVIEFIEDVANNYEVIREGLDRAGNQTYMLQLSDKHNNTLMVELSGDGTYWNINTAGIFKKSYGRNRKEVYNRHTTDKQPTEAVGVSQDDKQSGTESSSSMNTPTLSSMDKDSNTSEENKKNIVKLTENKPKKKHKPEKIKPFEATSDEMANSAVAQEILARTEPETLEELASVLLGNSIYLQMSGERATREMTGFGHKDLTPFLRMFRGKDKGGMTVEAAGDKLLEVARESYPEIIAKEGLENDNTGMAGTNAILSLISQSRTFSDISGYIRKNRIAEAQSAMDAENEYNERMEEEWIWETYHTDKAGLEALDNGEAFSETNAHTEEEIVEFYNNFADEILKEQYYDRRNEGVHGQGIGESQTDDSQGVHGIREGSDNVLRQAQPVLSSGEEGHSGESGQVYGQSTEDVHRQNDAVQGSSSGKEIASQIESARTAVAANPTESQKEAGNYKKGHVRIDGYEITIENPKGGVRSGTDRSGKKWSITMNNDYGYIRDTEAVDGDHIDVFLSDAPDSGRVFVVDQTNEDGSFDESKVMYGFNSLEEARAAYLSNYEKGWESRIMAITEVSKEEFKKWIDSSHRKTKAFSEYKSVKAYGPSIESSNVSRMQDIENRLAEIEDRKIEISDLKRDQSIGRIELAYLLIEEQDLNIEQLELEAEYSGLRAMNEESNAISEAEGSDLRFRKSDEKEEKRRIPLRDRAKEWEKKLGVKVNIMESLDDVTNKDASRAIQRGAMVTGWFEESTGEVCLFMPYLESEGEIDATYIHEVVAHKGLRGLLGDKFDSFLDKVWESMPEADRTKYLSYPGVNGDSRAAADEYIAHLAENVDVTESAWSKFTELFKKFLKAIGLEPKITDADIANTIKKSYQRLLEGGASRGAAGEGTKFSAKKKRALETASVSRGKHQPTVVSSADGAKILNNIDNLAKESRFRFIGEKGARNLDKAEEATTRLDNLSVAREMEASEKDAKTIKMATGWERGADGLWRYEVDDNISFETLGERNSKLRKAYDDANERYYNFESRVPSRTPKNATEEEKQKIKEMRKQLSKLRKEMGKAADAYYDSPFDGTTLEDFLGKDNQLFKEYPELKEVHISFVRNYRWLSQGFKGLYEPESNLIWIDDNRPKGDMKSSLIHEIQHAIQHIEGFAHGGSEAFFEKAKSDAQNRKYEFNQLINKFGFEDWEKNLPIEELMEYGKKYKGEFGLLHLAFIENAIEDKYVQADLRDELESVKAAYQRLYEKAGGERFSYKTPRDWYLSLSGEVEARNVQQRMGMNDEQRRNTLAESTEDVAREDQIFLKDGIESGMRFRISEKGKQIQAEVDKFTSKYKSKPVRIVEAEMDDNELMEALDNAFEIEDVKSFMAKSKTAAGYFHNLDKIIIFADRTKVERMEEYLFHENIHAAIHHNNFSNLVAHFYEYAKDKAVFEKWSKLAHNKEYKRYNASEEFLAYAVSNAMVARNLDDVAEYLEDKQKESLNKLFNVIGYDYDIRRRSNEQSGNGRTGEGTPGESSLEGDELLNAGEGRGIGEGTGEGKGRKISPKERKARLTELFGEVGSLGLDGVLGNETYNSLMEEVFDTLPENVRTQVSFEAKEKYDGNFIPAMSDYLNKGSVSVWDKIVGVFREAFRKIGIGLDFTHNDVKYLIWRNRNRINPYSVIDRAKDVDKRFSLKVGEFGDTESTIRFRVDGESQDTSSYESKIRNLEKAISRYENSDQIRKELIDLIDKELGSEFVGEITKQELRSLLLQVKNAKERRSRKANQAALVKMLMNIQSVVLNARRRKYQRNLDKLLSLKVQDVNGKNMSIAKNVDDSTRKIFSYMKGRVADLKVSGYDEDIQYLKKEIRGFNEQIQRLERQLEESKNSEKTKIQTEIDRILSKIDENKSLIEELKQLKADVEEAKLRQGDINLDREMKLLEEKMDDAAKGEATWTLGDSERLAALNIIQSLMLNKEKDYEVRTIEEEIEKLILNNSSLYKKLPSLTGDNREKINRQIEENRRQIAARTRLINDVRSLQVQQLQETIAQMNELIANGKNSLLKKIEDEAKRKSSLIGKALRSVEGKPVDIYDDKARRENWAKKFFSAPLGSFEYMAKRINTKTLGQDGFFYKYFVEGKEGVIEAENTYLKGMAEARRRLDEKTKEIFGKKFETVWKNSDKVEKNSGVYVYDTFHQDPNGYGVKYEKPLSKGQAMYIYMAWKMTDGRTKLEVQGFDEESIAEIVDFIGDDYIKLADWIQEELLSDLREKYNEKYLQMYNTSMANIPNYVPLRIRKEAVRQESDLSEDKERKKTLEERAGSLINRVANTKPVDITMSAFDVIFDHIKQMEEWNAYARVRRDLDAILSNTDFRNQLNANQRGSFENFYDAAAVATRSNRPDKAKYMDEVLGKLSKGIIGGNIAYRLNTALKQLLSAPAFFGYSQHPYFVNHLVKSISTFPLSYRWAKENIPSFRERVESGTAGNEKLNDEAISKALDKYIEWGMIPNKLVDAFVCSVGAKAIYDFKYGRLKASGVNEEEAKRQAIMEADIYYNATQQSSHPAFMSPVQMSRTFADRMLTTYQNSNIGYVRRWLSAMYDVMRSLKWKELKQNYTDMYMEQGLTKETAEAKAVAHIFNKNRKALITIALFSYGLNWLWDKGSQGLMGFLTDEPEEEKKPEEKLLKDFSYLVTTPIKGLPGGNLLVSLSEDYGMNPFLVYDEIERYMKEIKSAVDKYGLISPEIAYKALDLTTRIGGVDLEVWGNVYMGLEGAFRDGIGHEDDGIINFMLFLNSPKSQREAVAKNIYKDMSVLEYARAVQRAAKYVPKDDSWESWVPGVKEYSKRKESELKKEYKKRQDE